ncbi:hypothetical protein N7472_003162 [Penicillium cf. griseofulvum]|uniref:Uncharacterized protein n=1 Tax=Penicillium cf. griseofulvum TaxID=2972120 RepID=A0A9W9MSH8_9EURO|nr:hypothetical protein N7472_003162 [Penicillium cf. griseofulvum]
MLRIALKCHHTQSPHRLSQGLRDKTHDNKSPQAPAHPPDVSDIKCKCGITPGPHGQDRRRRAKTNDDAGCGLKIPPNFSFARVLAALGGTQNCEDGP